MTISRDVMKNKDGSKTYSYEHTEPGYRYRMRATIYSTEPEDESIFDRITIKKVKDDEPKKKCESCDSKSSKDDKRIEDLLDELNSFSDTEEDNDDLEDEILKMEDVSRTIREKYSAKDIEELKKNLHKILQKPENAIKVIELLMDSYLKSKE